MMNSDQAEICMAILDRSEKYALAMIAAGTNAPADAIAGDAHALAEALFTKARDLAMRTPVAPSKPAPARPTIDAATIASLRNDAVEWQGLPSPLYQRDGAALAALLDWYEAHS